LGLIQKDSIDHCEKQYEMMLEESTQRKEGLNEKTITSGSCYDFFTLDSVAMD
jgi:hypothetical protein